MTIRQKGNQWQVDVKVGANANPSGKEVRVRAAAPSKSDAETLEMQIRLSVLKTGGWAREEPDAGRKPKPKANQIGTLEHALKEAWEYTGGKKGGWKTQRDGKRQHARATLCCEFLGMDRMCSSITPDDIERLSKHWVGQNDSSDTVRTKIQSFYRVLWHAQRKGWILGRPLWDRPAPGIPREFIFSPTLEAKLVSYFHETHEFLFADLVTLGIETGCRSNELRCMSVDCYDLDAGVLRVPGEIKAVKFKTKTGQGRTVTLTPKAKETAKRLFEGMHPTDRPFYRFNHAQVSRRMQSARTALGYAGQEDFIFHALRHTRATRLAQQTRDPFVVMSQLGHAVIQTSMRYIKMVALDLDAYSARNTVTAAQQAAMQEARPGL